jgi:hypothetical protein
MRWLVLLVVVIIGLLFWYDPGGLGFNESAETPIVPTPTLLFNDISQFDLPTSFPTPIPPAEQVIGKWVRIGGPEQLEFTVDEKLFRTLDGTIKGYSYRLDIDRISIYWHDGPSGHYSYQYDFIDESLILTDRMGNQYIYLRASDELEHQASISLGPNPVTISGRLVGPAGVLAEQPITLERYTSCSVRLQPSTCKKEDVATILTDSTGQYKFLDVEPQYDYGLSFEFSIADPNQIPVGGLVKTDGYVSFVLSKAGIIGTVNNTILATSNIFYLQGLESEQMKIIDFIYPSTPPPTVTPSPATATPIASGGPSIPLPTSTPTVQATPPIWVDVLPPPPGKDFGSATKACMILAFYGDKTCDPETLAETAKAHEKVRIGSTIPEGIFNVDLLYALKQLGYEWQEDCRPIITEDFNQRLTQLQDNLVAGRPPLIGIYDEDLGYNVILVGYDPAKREYTYLDPEQVSVSEEELNKMWRETILDGSQRCAIYTSPR